MSKKLSVCHETAYVDFLALGLGCVDIHNE